MQFTVSPDQFRAGIIGWLGPPMFDRFVFIHGRQDSTIEKILQVVIYRPVL